MRFKSILALLVIGITSLGFVGCGSSGGTNDFVATTNDAGQSNVGNVVFNFTRPQSSFSVDANTNTLQFDFFDGAAQTPVFTTTRAFEAAITINNVPTSVRSVRITGFDASLIPLFTITQAIDVVGGNTITVDGISNAVPVALSTLRLAPGDLSPAVVNADPPISLTSLEVPIGGTGQVFFFADYSNGSRVLLGDKAVYTLGVGGDVFASVSNQGTVTGVAAGTTSLNAAFGGQTLAVTLNVTDPLNQNFDSIATTNTALTVSNATPLALTTSATRSIGGVPVVFALAPTDTKLNYLSSDAQFIVDTNTGIVTIGATVVAGTNATITTSYVNPNTSVLTVNTLVTAE